MKPVYLVIAHGSRDPSSNQACEEFLKKFQIANPDRRVEGSFLELAKPSVQETLEKCIRGGTKEIFILPLLLFPGRHAKEDVPRFIQEIKAKNPDVDFHYGSPLNEHPLLVSLLDDQATQITKRRTRQ